MQSANSFPGFCSVQWRCARSHCRGPDLLQNRVVNSKIHDKSFVEGEPATLEQFGWLRRVGAMLAEYGGHMKL